MKESSRLGLRPRCGDNITVPVLKGNTVVPVYMCVCVSVWTIHLFQNRVGILPT